MPINRILKIIIDQKRILVQNLATHKVIKIILRESINYGWRKYLINKYNA